MDNPGQPGGRGYFQAAYRAPVARPSRADHRACPGRYAVTVPGGAP